MPARSAESRKLSARLAAIERHRGPNDPSIKPLRRDLEVAQLAEHARRVAGALPPLTDDQVGRIVALLRPTAGDAR